MNLPKAKSTSKKFYGKWLYKITLTVKGSAMFRSNSLTDVIKYCDDNTTVYSQFSYAGRSLPHRPQLKKIAEFLQGFEADSWSTRIESEQIDFYSNDKSLYDALSLQFASDIIHRFEPIAGSEDQLESANTILVKKLPHKKYNFRVYLLPHKMANDKEGKKKYTDWLKQQDKITCTPAIEHWFYNTDWNWDRRYVLVEDEQTLLMLKLRNSEVVGRIYKFVISDK